MEENESLFQLNVDVLEGLLVEEQETVKELAFL